MSEYTTESPVSMERRQRRRRAFITIGVLLLGLFFAFWYGLSYYEADKARKAAQPVAPTCRPYDPDEIRPGDVQLNVYNATNRTGLAGRTASALEDRGFVVKKIANDPTDRKTPKVAELRYSKKGRPGALVVLDQMPEGTRGHIVKRGNLVVDVVLGTNFKGLGPAPQKPQLPMCPSPSPSASPSPASS